jgi:hypothetical protein
MQRLVALVDEFESLLAGAEDLGVTGGDEVTRAFEQVLEVFNDALGLARQNRLYLLAHISTNSRDNAAIARMSELQAVRARRTTAATRFVAWIGRIDVEALIAASATARAHAFPLRQAQVESAHLMDPAREALAAE